MELKLNHFVYDLPKEKIALKPLDERANAKMLHFSKNGQIGDYNFKDLPRLVQPGTLTVFNNTKVIPARIFFQKPTGALIELFLLEPVAPSSHEEIMASTTSCAWKCLIGNAKKWKTGTVLQHSEVDLMVERLDADQVAFSWTDGDSFSNKLLEIGKIPLPPYISREVGEDDKERYQTVYSKIPGAVAAPTAGLHFTDELLHELSKKVSIEYLTLHVSAGTFRPIKTEQVTEHSMHSETVQISLENIENLLKHNKVVAVGTTSLRTLESIYWYGVKLLHGEQEFSIAQTDPYSYKPRATEDALLAVRNHMRTIHAKKLSGITGIYIYPNYQFKVCDGLITNFHLPGSTLMLLVAAVVGPNWKTIYNHALDHNYRFLSYGDGSFLELSD